jgi:SAM-dependent methyltransferase
MTSLIPFPLPLDEDVVMTELTSRCALSPTTVVAEIGGNAGRTWAGRLGVGAWHSVDPRNDDGTTGVVTTWRALGERMPLESGSVDVVVSCNAFQFVDLVPVLTDAHRVLRPGGVLYAHFGPIWSGPDGHQLEYVDYRGSELRFWVDTLYPPYAHLRFTPSELAEVLASELPADLVEVLVWHVHQNPGVNRLFMEDYLDAFANGPWILREFATSELLDYPIVPPDYQHPRLTERLDLEALGRRTACARHGSHSLGTRDIRVMVQKA